MRNFPTKILVTLAASAFPAFAGPLAVPKIEDLIRPWLSVRASEASTLFIDKAHRGREPYVHLIRLSDNRLQWLEFDGQTTTLWHILKVTTSPKELSLQLQPLGQLDAEPSRLVIYPFRDIDHCLVLIRFEPQAAENPVRFLTPYHFKNQLEYLQPEG